MPTAKPSKSTALLAALGSPLIALLEYLGGLANMSADLILWTTRGIFKPKVRFGREALYIQIVRIGVRSVSIIVLVSTCIGLILVLQMAPPLEDFGQTDKVANVNAVAILRELGPLISAIVLTGFAGASIAAELGTMVVGEEIEALRAMALNPIRFLVVPRVIAAVISLIVLAVIADLIAVAAGAVIGVTALDIPWGIYYANTLEQAKLVDFVTGTVKAGVFGALIGLIACYNGLKVSGGAAGVGKATTTTVVHAIVAIIAADLAFTALFYALKLT